MMVQPDLGLGLALPLKAFCQHCLRATAVISLSCHARDGQSAVARNPANWSLMKLWRSCRTSLAPLRVNLGAHLLVALYVFRPGDIARGCGCHDTRPGDRRTGGSAVRVVGLPGVRLKRVLSGSNWRELRCDADGGRLPHQSAKKVQLVLGSAAPIRRSPPLG